VTTLVAESRTLNHHGSHRHLVELISPPQAARIDAIIVPTGRPTAYLTAAMTLARHHGCTLVVLCSLRSSAPAAKRMASAFGVEIIAVDMDKVSPGLMPRFATTDLLRRTRFESRTDTGTKRSFGLLLGWMSGWERIVFLDDDIRIPAPADLTAAVGALGRFASVGLTIEGYPDNSVVCHAYRMAGGRQDTFIGGGALAVGVESFDSLFPDIYNEDWFFLLNDNGLRQSAVTTGVVVQSPYDPFSNSARARSEELGDSLAEGLFRLLDDSRPLTDATHGYWRDFLVKRRLFIDEVITMARAAAVTQAERNRMIGSLKAAWGRNRVIDPQLCVDYLDAWRADRKLWRDMIHTTRRDLGTQKALAELGLMHCHHPRSCPEQTPSSITRDG
jgi:hypothetical protein